ncbi:MAG: site-specific integrase [Clostridia bacterium]|nr:site-specific integrase [Clostridia bacterium]
MTKLNIKGISVDHKPRKDGRYQARYTTEDGKQHSVYGRTPEEAQRKAVAGYRGVKTQNKKCLTFAEWYDKWIDLYKKPKLRPNTLKTYKYTSGKYLLPRLGKIRLNQLDTNKLQETLNRIELLRQREIAGNILVACITKAYTVGQIKSNPALGIEKTKHDYQERRSLTSQEQDRLLSYIQGNRFETLIYVYLYAGLRRSEALALRWADIDLSNGTITVRYQMDEKRQLVELKTRKGNRTIPILPPLRSKLETLPHTGEYLFEWKPSRITQEFRILFDNIGLQDIDVHSLRHTYATMLKDMGVPDDLRTKWLGHSKLDHKDRYEHILTEYELRQIDRVIDKFDTKNDT